MNHIFYFDYWFTSVNLLVQLAKKEIFAIATASSNRLLGCEMQSEKELKHKGRGSFEEKETTIDDIVVRAVKWFDNRPVTLAIYPLCTVDRWDRSQRQSISVCCPAIVGKYNQNMGGVDALDALISYYRIGIRSKKYYHRFFFIWLM